MSAVIESMYAPFVCALASGNAASAFDTAAASSAETSVSRFRLFSNAPSNVAWEIVIGPRPSASSTGDFSIASTVSASFVPLAEVTASGSPTFRWCSVAQPLVDDRAVLAEAGDRVVGRRTRSRTRTCRARSPGRPS